MKLKGIIFDADGPLYYRIAPVKEAEQQLLQRFELGSKLAEFEDLYEQLRFKAFVRDITVSELPGWVKRQCGN